MRRTVITAIAGAAALALTGPAAAHPLPPGWTELTCVVLDARQIVLDVTTGREVPGDASGNYRIGPYTAKLVNGELLDATTGVALPVVNRAIVDQAGTPIVMVSTWSRIACPPGVSIGQPGPQGPAGPAGVAGAQGAPGAQGPQGVTGVTQVVRTAALVPPKAKAKPVKRRVVKKAKKTAVKGVRQLPVAG